MTIKLHKIAHNITLYRMRGKNKYLAKNFGKAKFHNTVEEAKLWIEKQIELRGKKRKQLKDL